MRVAVLSPVPHRIAEAFRRAGDVWESFDEPPEDADFVVSFGHSKIIREPHLSRYAGRIVNLHPSWLPWNRGSNPNLWSWFDRTPKGVTLHEIDAGVDTGRIICREEIRFDDDETLETSRVKLWAAGASLFVEAWPRIRTGEIEPQPQSGPGTSHRIRDAEPIWRRLPRRGATPVSQVEALGDELRTSLDFRIHA
jgi:methionyl-tRNA formyltransferase